MSERKAKKTASGKTGVPRWAWLAGGAALLALVPAVLALQVPRDVRTTGVVSGGTSSSGEAAIGGPFELVDHTGKTVTQEDFLGRPMLVYIGFTFCPDVCPTSLAAGSAALAMLGEAGEDVQLVFITVDPERDTVEQMADYVSLFDPAPVGLTGTLEQTDAAARQYRAYYQIVKDNPDDENYTVDHSSYLYLMGEDGRYVTHFNHNDPPGRIARGIAEALGLDATALEAGA